MESSKKSQSRQKKGYDEKVRGAVLQPGDRVLVKILAFEGKHKLSDRWESDAYTILEQPNPEIPVFVVRKESGDGRKRTLHRNLLLPIGSISMDEQTQPEQPVPRPRLRPRKQQKPVPKPRTTRRGPLTRNPQPPASSVTESDSESEDESYLVLVPQTIDEPDITTNSDEETGQSIDADDEEVIEETEDAPSSDVELEQDGEEVADTTIEEDTGDATVNDEPGQDGSENDDDDDEIPEVPRRSSRNKTSTATTRYKDFVCKQSQSKTDWLTKAQFVKDAALCGLLRGSEDKLADALLKLVTDDT